jgi:hypothetical protein
VQHTPLPRAHGPEKHKIIKNNIKCTRPCQC